MTLYFSNVYIPSIAFLKADKYFKENFPRLGKYGKKVIENSCW
jgi:hypothetical protein